MGGVTAGRAVGEGDNVLGAAPIGPVRFTDVGEGATLEDGESIAVEGLVASEPEGDGLIPG